MPPMYFLCEKKKIIIEDMTFDGPDNCCIGIKQE